MFLENEQISCNDDFIGLATQVHWYSDEVFVAIAMENKFFFLKQSFYDEAFVGLAKKLRWCTDEVFFVIATEEN